MDIRYIPSLMERVVLEAIRRREAMGDLRLSTEYHRLVDPIYERPPVEREARFNAVHQQVFRALGFEDAVRQALDEYPNLAGRVESVVVTTATRREEEADLIWGTSRAASMPAIGLKVRPERFLDPSALQRFLRHELMHVWDMLDPSFRYEPENGLPGGSSTEINMLKDRYRMLWDLSIDARVIRTAKDTVSDQDGRRTEFRALYRKLPPVQADAVFERLWDADRPSHEELLAMARDVRVLLERTGMTDTIAHPGVRTLMPGTPCPLCRFPTFAWAEDVDLLPAEVLDAVRMDYPEWTPEDGACERCLEAYQARAGVWL